MQLRLDWLCFLATLDALHVVPWLISQTLSEFGLELGVGVQGLDIKILHQIYNSSF